MKSREIGKSRQLCDIIVEKLLEMGEYIFYSFRRKRKWTSHLIESYRIYDKFIEEEFVKNFLSERRKALRLNKYKMEIKVLPHDEKEEESIGKVLLMRHKKLISTATLKIKKSDKADNKLIYWSFD